MLWLKFEPSNQAVYSLPAGSRGRDGPACEGSKGTGGGIETLTDSSICSSAGADNSAGTLLLAGRPRRRFFFYNI